MTRTERAHRLARLIEQAERCPVMTQASIDNIEIALADYAIERLVELRAELGQMTLAARGKAAVVAAVTAAIAKVSQSS